MEIDKIKLHKVIKCKPEDSIKDISKKLKKNKERRIFVVDSKDKLIGIITTTDLVYKALAEENKNLKAKDVMTDKIQSVESNESLDKALEIMNSLKSFVCPITEKGKIIGLISYHDLVGYVIASMKD